MSQVNAPSIEALKWETHPSGIGGHRAVVTFKNGYSASVIKGGPFYTTDGTFEIAVMHNDRICYDTPITDDVLGYLTAREANQALSDIEKLPRREVKP